MESATHRDVVRLFPGIQDHTIAEILDTGASLNELEAVALLLADQDESPIDKDSANSVVVACIADFLRAEGYPAEQDDDGPSLDAGYASKNS